MKKTKIDKTTRIIKIILLAMSVFWFIFSWISGAKPGFKGFLMNFPNTIPWIILILLIGLLWKFEFAGGILITILGIFTIFIFDAIEQPFVLLTISLPLTALGLFFVVKNLKRKNKKK